MTLPLVLIVDDNPENLTVIGELLQPGHVVRAANSGARALKLAAMDPLPDLILLDVMMPEMDGYEVLSRLRATPLTAEVPVIFLTALNSSADEERGLMLGAADYITKPIRPAVLLARVRTQLELKLARDAVRDREQWVAEELCRRQREGDALQDVGLHALARLAERGDAAVGRHLLRTQSFVRLLAETLCARGGAGESLDNRSIELLVRAVPLHDLGKAALPDAVLHKPAVLDEADWRLMRQHAEAGARALQAAGRDLGVAVPVLDVAQQLARSHHERWDGQGYPDGLSGLAIPVGARLLAVANDYDGLQIGTLAVPAQQGMHREGVAQVVKSRPFAAAAVADAASVQQFPEIAVHATAVQPAAARRWEEVLVVRTRPQRGRVLLQTNDQGPGRRHQAVLAELGVVDAQHPLD